MVSFPTRTKGFESDTQKKGPASRPKPPANHWSANFIVIPTAAFSCIQGLPGIIHGELAIPPGELAISHAETAYAYIYIYTYIYMYYIYILTSKSASESGNPETNMVMSARSVACCSFLV